MQFRKKPVVIEACRLPTDDNISSLLAWAIEIGFSCFTRTHDGSLAIETLEGVMTASPGDWIIRGVKNEFYPCKPNIFYATYECTRCNGRGTIAKHCEDPQCGDSTWDHECGEGTKRCECATVRLDEAIETNEAQIEWWTSHAHVPEATETLAFLHERITRLRRERGDD